MAISKVVYNSKTLVDLTSDTVTASSMLSSATAHDKAGNAITGSIATQSASGTTTLTASTTSITFASGYYSGSNTVKVEIYDGTFE